MTPGSVTVDCPACGEQLDVRLALTTGINRDGVLHVNVSPDLKAVRAHPETCTGWPPAWTPVGRISRDNDIEWVKTPACDSGG